MEWSLAETTRTCPRCGGRMMLRLDEYECARCGHFIARDADEEESDQGARRGPLHIHTAQQPPPTGQLMTVTEDKADQRLTVEKRVFIVLFALYQLAGGFVYLVPQQNAPPPTGTVLNVVLSALIATALAALVLFIDWYPFKKVVIILLVLDVILLGYSVYLGYTSAHMLIAGKRAVDIILQVWLAAILFRDINLNE